MSIMSIRSDWKGPKQEPTFTRPDGGLLQGGAHYDHENVYPARVQPGDTILMHAGLYIGDRFHYLNGDPKPGNLAMGNISTAPITSPPAARPTSPS